MTAIVEYSATEAALIELQGRLKDVIYEVSTPSGLELARKDRRELVTLRTSLEARRKELKAPILERGKLLDDEAKRITAELVKLEKPIDDQIVAEEARREAIRKAKAEAEAKRVADIRKRIHDIALRPANAAGLSSAGLVKIIAATAATEVGAETFGEFAAEAAEAKTGAVERLEAMLASAQAAEAEAAKLAAERAEFERQRLEQERAARAEAARLEELARIQREEQEKAAAAERAELKRIRDQQEAEQREALAKLEKQRAEQEAAAKAEAKRQANILAAERKESAERAESERRALEAMRQAQQEEQAKLDQRAAEIAEKEAAAVAALMTSEAPKKETTLDDLAAIPWPIAATESAAQDAGQTERIVVEAVMSYHHANKVTAIQWLLDLDRQTLEAMLVEAESQELKAA